MYVGLKKKKGYSVLTGLSYSFVCGELQRFLDRGCILMYLVEDHIDHTHFFIQLKKGISIDDTIFHDLLSPCYFCLIRESNSKDFIEYMHFNEEVC